MDCFAQTGSGAVASCQLTTGVTSCGSTLGPGHCPATGLVGCCVAPIVGSETGGACYYNATEAANAKPGCKSQGAEWTTTAP
jgi:hypothetical protein